MKEANQPVLSERLKDLAINIDMAEKVGKTLDTDGWKDIIEPLINKMIVDVLGGQEDGRWFSGVEFTGRSEMDIDQLIAYRRALIDLHSNIYSMVDNLEADRTAYNTLLKQEQEPEYTEVRSEYAPED